MVDRFPENVPILSTEKTQAENVEIAKLIQLLLMTVSRRLALGCLAILSGVVAWEPDQNDAPTTTTWSSSLT